MGYKENLAEEFKTVDLLLPSDTRTGRTDAFIISRVKIEKQMRRIFTYTVYQLPASFTPKQIIDLLAEKEQRLYFGNFFNGFNNLYSKLFNNS